MAVDRDGLAGAAATGFALARDFDAEDEDSPPLELELLAADDVPEALLSPPLEADVVVAPSDDDEAVDLLASAAGADGASSFSPTRLRLFSLSDLKSVSYQPEPLSRNTGAEISLTSAFAPQDGHFVSGGSEIFCMTSVRTSHFEH